MLVLAFVVEARGAQCLMSMAAMTDIFKQTWSQRPLKPRQRCPASSWRWQEERIHQSLPETRACGLALAWPGRSLVYASFGPHAEPGMSWL